MPGSKFRRIPRTRESDQVHEGQQHHLDNLDSGRKKVLVVDDDTEIVELITDILTRDGRYEIRTASSAYEAGMVTQMFHPDLILLDYMLPDVNGNVVCQTIRNNPEFENTRIIIVSGVIKQEEIDQLSQVERRIVYTKTARHCGTYRKGEFVWGWLLENLAPSSKDELMDAGARVNDAVWQAGALAWR